MFSTFPRYLSINASFYINCSILIRIHWYLSLGFQLTTSKTDSDKGLVPIRPQAIVWTNTDIVYWHIYAPLGLNYYSLRPGDACVSVNLTNLASRKRIWPVGRYTPLLEPMVGSFSVEWLEIQINKIRIKIEKKPQFENIRIQLDSPQKGPVTRKIFLFDDVIMSLEAPLPDDVNLLFISQKIGNRWTEEVFKLDD